MRRISALTVLVVLLSSWALPADAGTGRLRLTSSTVTPVVQLQPDAPVLCDAANFFACGYVDVEAAFSGLAGRALPGPGDDPRLLNAGGTASIARTYGCRTAAGKRVRRYDRTVREDVTMNTRRGIPLMLPEEDPLQVQVYAFLLDAQPGDCPAGTEARMYRFTVRDVTVELESRWPSVPSSTYRIRGRAVWNGSVPTPALGG